FASASGRTFEGPQPKRPSSGFRSDGMETMVSVVAMRRQVIDPRRSTGYRPETLGGEMYPVHYEVDFQSEQNRATTFFRIILAIPWLIVGYLYEIAAF